MAPERYTWDDSQLRAFRPDDRVAVERLFVEHAVPPRFRSSLRRLPLIVRFWLAPYLDGEPESVWIAERRGEPVGFLAAQIRPMARARMLRHRLPLAMRMLAQKGGDNADTRTFLRRFAGRSWRDVPRSNVLIGASEEVTSGLLDALLSRLRGSGSAHFRLHLFAEPGASRVADYRRLGFAIRDVRPSRVFGDGTSLVTIEREIAPEVPRVAPRLSVVIPVHNEASVLPDLLQDLQTQILPPDQIVVVADNCTDDSEAVAIQMGAEVVRGTFGHCGPARNAGLEVATGDVIIVCDADSRLGPDFVASVVQAVDAGYECGGPTLRADEAKAASRFFVAGQNVARAVLRCSYGTAYFATRDLFERGGKYDPSLRWGEDVEISLRHRLVGRACLLPSRVIWSCRRLRENGRLAEVSRRVWRAICYTPTVLARLREAHAALPRRSVHSN